MGCGLTQCTGQSGVKTNYESGIATNPLIMVCEYSHSPIIEFPPYLAGPSCTSKLQGVYRNSSKKFSGLKSK